MVSEIIGGFSVGLAVWLFTWGVNRSWLVFKGLIS